MEKSDGGPFEAGWVGVETALGGILHWYIPPRVGMAGVCLIGFRDRVGLAGVFDIRRPKIVFRRGSGEGPEGVRRGSGWGPERVRRGSEGLLAARPEN